MPRFAVAAVSAELNSEDALASDFVFLEAAKEFGGLARKHGAHNELNPAPLVESFEFLEVFFVGSTIGEKDLAGEVLVERTVHLVCRGR